MSDTCKFDATDSQVLFQTRLIVSDFHKEILLFITLLEHIALSQKTTYQNDEAILGFGSIGYENSTKLPYNSWDTLDGTLCRTSTCLQIVIVLGHYYSRCSFVS
jgi:hypothetical protein